MMFRRLLYLIRGESMPVVAKKQKMYPLHLDDLVEYIPGKIYPVIPHNFYETLYNSEVIRSRNDGNKT